MLDLLMTYGFALLPLGSLLAVELYIAPYDGWGAWAAAPLLLVPAILGFVLALFYAMDLLRMKKLKAPIREQVIQLFLALIPVFWLFVRRLVL